MFFFKNTFPRRDLATQVYMVYNTFMNMTFPENFLWGASTSAHQVEGDNKYNDWWQWEKTGAIESSGRACDHYNRFREDFLIAKDLGHNAHRLGLEWSRLQKEEDIWDMSEWDHYKEVLDELLNLGIEPVLTLHHFTLPIWLADKGGWENPESVKFFKRFAEKAMKELGSRVTYWITINEPNILAILGYYRGLWTPCKKDFPTAIKVLANMTKAHTEAYTVMREVAVSKNGAKNPIIGIAKAVTAFHPRSPFSLGDRPCTWLRSRFHNHLFIKSIIEGKLLYPRHPKEKLPRKNAVDFIGINYYFRQFIYKNKPLRENPFGEVGDSITPEEMGPRTDMGWEIYPEGIYEVTKSLSRYGLPMMVTENGLASRDDALRSKYIKDHLRQVLRAINDGYPVLGYLHWSLLDNFEWAEGYSKKFGLVEVDLDTQKRTIRPSARDYAEIIKTGKIPE